MKACKLPSELVQDCKIERHEVELFVSSNDVLENDENWARLSLEQFAAGYNDADGVYDTLE